MNLSEKVNKEFLTLDHLEEIAFPEMGEDQSMGALKDYVDPITNNWLYYDFTKFHGW